MVESSDHITKLTCNICNRVVEGIAYRTSCLHFFCPSCSQQSFTGSCRCPVCSNTLAGNDIHEIIVGMTSPVESVDAVFQLVLQNCSWSYLLENERQFSLSMIELHSFISVQLSLNSRKNSCSMKSLQDEASTLKQERDQLVSEFQRFQVFAEEQHKQSQSQLSSIEREIADIKEAYKEKMRKCLAWEKAYSALRDQLAGRSTHLVPPEQEESQRNLPVIPRQEYFAPRSEDGSPLVRKRTEICTARRDISYPLPSQGLAHDPTSGSRTRFPIEPSNNGKVQPQQQSFSSSLPQGHTAPIGRRLLQAEMETKPTIQDSYEDNRMRKTHALQQMWAKTIPGNGRGELQQRHTSSFFDSA